MHSEMQSPDHKGTIVYYSSLLRRCPWVISSFSCQQLTCDIPWITKSISHHCTEWIYYLALRTFQNFLRWLAITLSSSNLYRSKASGTHVLTNWSILEIVSLRSSLHLVVSCLNNAAWNRSNECSIRMGVSHVLYAVRNLVGLRCFACEHLQCAIGKRNRKPPWDSATYVVSFMPYVPTIATV